MKDILEFQGENRWLSNFWPVFVELDGVTFPSIENAYQAAKTFPENREDFVWCTAGQSKRLGRKVPMRPEWDEIKIKVMSDLIKQKFKIGSPLAKKLIATGSVNIVEGNTWGDCFWGVCNGKGNNHLGKLLMEQRNFLQEQEK